MRYFIFVLVALTITPLSAQFSLSGRANRQLQKLVEFNEVFATGHTGFCLYDLESENYLYGHNPDRYFVPASNVKLLTFYLANKVLDHRATAIFYQEFTDRIELWGAGYPLTLHPNFGGFDELTPWLATQSLPLVLNTPAADELPRYGAGWSWDDYDYGYVFERSAFPLYGNRLYFDLAPVDAAGNQQLVGSPPTVAGALVQSPQQRRSISRTEFGNEFSVNDNFFNARNFPLARSLRMSPELVADNLSDIIAQVPFRLGNRPRPPADQLGYHEVSVPDTVYRRLLQDSDNFLAEQLVIQAAARRYGHLDEEAIMDYAMDTLFSELGLGKVNMRDGSGLSRYNLAQPRQLARLVMALDREVGHERLLGLLPAGGKRGTLKRRFDDREETYVWAKTGSLSGVICISGLVKTKDDKWLAFSFTHNNVMGKSSDYYAEMERILGWVYENL